MKIVHKYTDEDIAYIVENFHVLDTEEIAKHIGVSKDGIERKADRLRRDGAILKPSIRYRHFTPEEDELIIAMRPTRTLYEIGLKLNAVDNVVGYRCNALREQAKINKDWKTYDALSPDAEYTQLKVIRDGYYSVPWHMRIDGRNQSVPTMDYDALTLDNDVCYDESLRRE